MTARKKREEKNPTKVVKNKNKKTQSLRTDSFFIWGVSLTHPVMASFYVGSFSHTSHAGFFMWGVTLTPLVLTSLCGRFFLHMFHAGLFMLGVYLTHPVLAA